MDSDEAARAVFSRIQAIDPQNAYKIIAFVLLQNQAEKEMIRLAFGPDNLIHSLICAAKTQLGLSSTLSSPIPISISRSNPLILPHTNGFHPSPPSIWSVSPSNFSSSPTSRLNNYQDLSFPHKDADFAPHSLQRSDSLPHPSGKNGCFSKRSCSMDDSWFVSEDSSSGHAYKPRGYDKFDALEQCQYEFMRLKAAQRQRLAAAHYLSGLNANLPYNKLNFVQKESQRSAAAALTMGEELHKWNHYRMSRSDFSGSGCADSNASQQIYLTFPADSIFREEDVSSYFSMFGPVQDVRIPFQQKRMFGFVTFVYPETVAVILSKSNPHFICDSRVLVKPYKEKGELLDKKQQQLDRSEFFSCGSPSSLDIQEPFEMHAGPRLLYKNHVMMLRKKLEEEAYWDQALEQKNRSMMNLKLSDLNNHYVYQQNPPLGSPPGVLNQNNPFPSAVCKNTPEGNNSGSLNGSHTEQQAHKEVCVVSDCGNHITKEDDPERKSYIPESSERVLDAALFASPTNFTAEELPGRTSKPVGLDNAATISSSTADNGHL